MITDTPRTVVCMLRHDIRIELIIKIRTNEWTQFY